MKPKSAMVLALASLVAIAAAPTLSSQSAPADSTPQRRQTTMDSGVQGRLLPPEIVARMSPALRLALGRSALARAGGAGILPSEPGCVSGPGCEMLGGHESPPATQSEVSIDADESGRHIVVGFNDFRGFIREPSAPLSVSGFMYSEDGGRKFVDGGQLPTVPGLDVFGDPDVKYLGNGVFIYSSILREGGNLFTLAVHRSRDYGRTWEGPFEIPAATDPAGFGADKEFLAVDPDTGRVMVSWTNFTPAAPAFVEIATAFSDDAATATPPTWSRKQVVSANVVDGQYSIARFAGSGSRGAYIAWVRYTSFFGRLTGFATSDDNGETWNATVNLGAEFMAADQVLGNDRVDNSPSLEVGPGGEIYVVYANNDLLDGADVVFQRSTDGGRTFSSPLLINGAPGGDRSQWFPWIAADRTTGRIYVYYYDQGVATSGDLTEVSVTTSDDGGRTWSPPVPLNERPFHAGWGNDLGQPNLGDYNQAVARRGALLAAYAVSRRLPGGFADGEPESTRFTVPDVAFTRIRDDQIPRRLPARLGAIGISDSGGDGTINAGERVDLSLAIADYVTNPVSASRLVDLKADLFSATPGVKIVKGTARYPDLAAGDTASNDRPFVLDIGNGFKARSPIELRLDVKEEGGRKARLFLTLFTESSESEMLLSEDFENIDAATGLPAGWQAGHGAGLNEVPWITSGAFCNTGSHGAFHPEAEDGVPPAPGQPPYSARFERLFGPVITVPRDAEYVTLEMDICTNSEDLPILPVTAVDGFFLRIADMTPGRIVRSVLVEAFADEFTTGASQGYPKQLLNFDIPFYFPDMAAWAGDSGGPRHVRMRLPGMAGSTVQLRFEYTQAGGGVCAQPGPTGGCGVFFDNLVVKSHSRR
jgi:hypothetical protein